MNMDLLTCLKDPMTREVRLLRKLKVVEQDNDHYRDVFIPNGIQFRFVLNDARYLQRIPGLFRGIIQKAKQILQVLIRETEIPPKPTLSVDMAEYRTMTWPHGSGRSRVKKSPSRHRLKRRASARNSGTWRRRPSAGTTHSGSRPDLAATIMTENAKTNKHTAGRTCGAYIETPCKFSACRAQYSTCNK